MKTSKLVLALFVSSLPMLVSAANAQEMDLAHTIGFVNEASEELAGMIAPPPFCSHEISPEAAARALVKEVPASKIPLFQSQDIIEMEMKSDFAAVNAGQKHVKKWPATITYENEKGKPESVPVEISSRGNSKQKICAEFKPLKIFFDEDKDKYKSTLFAHTGKGMKLATHCSGMGSHPVDDVHSQLVIREYATYRILEEAGIPGFKARLVHMKYKDNNDKQIADGYAFFLEPEDKMASRWGYEKQRRNPAAAEAAKKPKTEDDNAVNMASYSLGLSLAGGIDHGYGHNTIPLYQNGKQKGEAFYDLDMSMLANPKIYSKWRRKQEYQASEDERSIQIFIENHPNGAKGAKEFLDNALAHRKEAFEMIDSLPLKEKAFMKARLEQWYSSIENVRTGMHSFHSVTIPQIENGNYTTRW